MYKILKQIDFFANFSDEDFAKLEQHISFKKYNQDNIVFYESDTPKYFYILISGEVNATKSNFKNNPVLINTFRAVSFIAEMAVIENIPFPATATCANECEIIQITKEPLLDLIKSDTNIAFGIIKSLTKKIKTLEHTININILFDATQKVMSHILNNPDSLKTSKHTHIAKILNTTPETLSRTIKKLKDQNIIDDNYNVDIEKLKMLI
ncbi:MAG: Crp/Fnr family transcriptional regulator [Arcobacteraceae bacterium]|jgi:CRP-like cAMP-binding protein|nr:Crp/Fnr family transcriptional regulator [Arcobacteraceae bacterium]MDY0326860.1 Crp/Fnr family transcriptional regulator [Arcobacteraceae bacterium]